MSKFPDKVKVVTADQPFHKIDLSHSHMTTNSFFKVSIPLAYECMPNSSFTLDLQNFVRLNPLVLPTMGKVKVCNKFFFVPFRTCWKPFLNFITQTPTQLFNSKGDSIIDTPVLSPIINNGTILEFLSSYSRKVCTYHTLSGGEDLSKVYYKMLYENPGMYDYVVLSDDGNHEFYKLTDRGRFYLKLLNQLGYYPIFESSEGADNVTYSALPLLCAAKVYYDYFENSSYIASESRLVQIRKLLESRDLSLQIDDSMLELILELFLVMGYSPDSFVSAWDNPASPNIDNFDFQVKDNTADNGMLITSHRNSITDNGTPQAIEQGGVTHLTQNALNLLHQLSDQVHRRQVVGGREVDLFLAEYGIKPRDDGRSYYLGGNDFYVSFNEVMSNADTDGASLGSYAGKAAGYGNSNTITFNSNGDFGMLLCLTYIKPDIAYCQGAARHIFHKTRFDFFTPEYDSLGVQAISQQEVLSPMYYLPNYIDNYKIGNLSNKVFGFLPRYSEYKYINNHVTGDFMFSSMGSELPAWHLSRIFSPLSYFSGGRSSSDPYEFEQPVSPDDVETLSPVSRNFSIVHSRAFMWSYDEGTYNRIFYSSEDIDNFYCFYDFRIFANMPCRSIFDDYDYDSAGREIVMSLNGSQIS